MHWSASRACAVALACLAVAACGAPDHLDLEPRIELAPDVTGVEVGQTVSFSATYYDTEGMPVPDASFTWASSDESVVTIDSAGAAHGVTAGQAEISAGYSGVEGSALLSVVEDRGDVATITLTPADGTLDPVGVGETVQFSAEARDLDGNLLSPTLEWVSSDAAVSIDADGLATAMGNGSAEITAHAGAISSAATQIVVADGRVGSFVDKAHHTAGTATLLSDAGGTLTLELGGDFTTVAGPDLNVYLSKASGVDGDSLDLGDLKANNGAQTYSVPSGVALDDYDYVVIWCVTFAVDFGEAELQ